MIHARPEIKGPPGQHGVVPSFGRSHTHVVAAASVAAASVGAGVAGADLTTVITHGQIAERAYDIYVQNGRQEDQSQQNWEQAECDLRKQGLVACHAEHVIKDFFAPDSIEA